jgi:hypothetical protein
MLATGCRTNLSFPLFVGTKKTFCSFFRCLMCSKRRMSICMYAFHKGRRARRVISFFCKRNSAWNFFWLVSWISEGGNIFQNGHKPVNLRAGAIDINIEFDITAFHHIIHWKDSNPDLLLLGSAPRHSYTSKQMKGARNNQAFTLVYLTR